MKTEQINFGKFLSTLNPLPVISTQINISSTRVDKTVNFIVPCLKINNNE